MTRETVTRGLAVSLAAALALRAGAASRRAAAKSETPIYAAYDGQNTADEVFKSMRAGQGEDTGERIEAYAVVSKDINGKCTSSISVGTTPASAPWLAAQLAPGDAA